jgi:hypothetical protein
MGLARHLSKTKKPQAVIVKGNPKYLNDPHVKPLAEAFYSEIQSLLEERGFEVTFDAGEPMTSPNETAAVWIGHSRGIDRLRFAPLSVMTVELETKEDKSKYRNFDQLTNDRRGRDPLHYQLSDTDRQRLMHLSLS